jgi:hypothetical protein
MKFCVVEQQGSKYFHSIDEASKILGVTRRTFFEYLKQVKVEPWDRKLVRQKSYFSEEILGRMWVLQRRFGRTGNGGKTGVVQNPLSQKGGPENKPIEPRSKPQSAEQKAAMQNKISK